MLAKILCFANTFPSSAEQEEAEASAAPLVGWRFLFFVCAMPLGLGLLGRWVEGGGSAKPLSPVLCSAISLSPGTMEKYGAVVTPRLLIHQLLT